MHVRGTYPEYIHVQITLYISRKLENFQFDNSPLYEWYWRMTWGIVGAAEPMQFSGLRLHLKCGSAVPPKHPSPRDYRN